MLSRLPKDAAIACAAVTGCAAKAVTGCAAATGCAAKAVFDSEAAPDVLVSFGATVEFAAMPALTAIANTGGMAVNVIGGRA